MWRASYGQLLHFSHASFIGRILPGRPPPVEAKSRGFMLFAQRFDPFLLHYRDRLRVFRFPSGPLPVFPLELLSPPLFYGDLPSFFPAFSFFRLYLAVAFFNSVPSNLHPDEICRLTSCLLSSRSDPLAQTVDSLSFTTRLFR